MMQRRSIVTGVALNKRNLVKGFFEAIGHRYDLADALMSFGLHFLWRRHCLRGLDLRRGSRVLDLCGGTGAFARRIAAQRPDATAVVCDFSRSMLNAGKSIRSHAGFAGRIEWVQGDAERLGFTHRAFDAVIVGFGIRNLVDANAKQMLDAAKRCLDRHATKFVLLVGDQMYADMPSRLSLFNRDYFQRLHPRADGDIRNCSPAEIRRFYQQRYRYFLALPGWAEILSRYPCYMMWDDHDIVDNWGSAASHQETGWKRVMAGARHAFMDYQGSRVLENRPVLPDAFDFGFRYGTAAVYVMDIRSNRRTGHNGRICAPDQFFRLRRFIDRHIDAQVLLLVLTVPIIHLPRHLSRLAARLSPEQEDFSDRWSSQAHVHDRDRLLVLLDRHRRRHPRQKVVLISGDIHIGCAHRISFGNGAIYQLIASGVTHGSNALVRIGSELLIRVNRIVETADHRLRGRLDLLEKDGHGSNPYGGLNVGLIEICKSASVDGPRMRFLLYGHRKGRPVCVYRSPWL